MNCPQCGYKLDKVLGVDDAYVCYTVACPVTRIEINKQEEIKENDDRRKKKIC